MILCLTLTHTVELRGTSDQIIAKAFNNTKQEKDDHGLKGLLPAISKMKPLQIYGTDRTVSRFDVAT
jgi:ribosomal protein S7